MFCDDPNSSVFNHSSKSVNSDTTDLHPCQFTVPEVPIQDSLSQVKPQLKVKFLESSCFVLPGNRIFIDKVLPNSKVFFAGNVNFPPDYFVTLHQLVSCFNASYPTGTPNYRGARIPLRHTKLNIQSWRQLLVDYEDVDIVQFLEYGFPLGLSENPVLESSLQNHGSSYQYFNYIDEFISSGLGRCELTGPFKVPPFSWVHVSPLMTAPKKPASRRAVFDATFGDFSLNNNTIGDTYCDGPCIYDYPTVDDFKQLVLCSGEGCFMWKRDLSRFYLQIPLDPIEYPKVCYVWRNKLFFFVSLMFGLTHSGLQGQKITRAVTWIHQRLGLNTAYRSLYTSVNYSDDIGGVEKTLERSSQSYIALGELLKELGLEESLSKAHPPSTIMPYLGVLFNTNSMTMSIPGDKIEEIRNELNFWLKRRTVNKRTLQKLLGKLFWIARCVKFSRGFMGRLLGQLRELHDAPDHKKYPLTEACRLDIQWWARYVRRFNGVEILYPENPLDLGLDDLVRAGAIVYCGDAQPLGGGAYCGLEYWAQPFPTWLQDDRIPIHIKEFYVLVASTALWGDSWRGKVVYMFCDNSAVVHVLEKERPRDKDMSRLLREFLYLVCTRNFTPIFKHVGSKANHLADFLSRHNNQTTIENYLSENSISMSIRRNVPDSYFKCQSIW